jgi:hypothetical protein
LITSAKVTPRAAAVLPTMPSAPMPISFQRRTSSVTGFISVTSPLDLQHRAFDLANAINQVVHAAMHRCTAGVGFVLRTPECLFEVFNSGDQLAKLAV